MHRPTQTPPTGSGPSADRTSPTAPTAPTAPAERAERAGDPSDARSADTTEARILQRRLAEARDECLAMRDRMHQVSQQLALLGQRLSTVVDAPREAPPPASQSLVADGRSLAFADVLQALANRRVTGVLDVADATMSFELHLVGGELALAHPRQLPPSLPEDPTHIDGTTIDPAHFRILVDANRADDQSVWLSVLDGEPVAVESIRRVLLEFALDAMRPCVKDPERWTYRFRSAAAPVDAFRRLHLKATTSNFLLRLLSRADEWEFLARTLEPHRALYRALGATPASAETVPVDDHRTILAALDGWSSIGDLTGRCRLSRFQVLSGLYTLDRLSLIQAVETDLERAALPEATRAR